MIKLTLFFLLLFSLHALAGNSLFSQFNELIKKEDKQDIGKIINYKLEIQNMDGVTSTLEKFKGNPLVIVFWGAWCKPCQAELPLLIDAQHKYTNSHFIFVPVNSTEQNIRSTMNKFGGNIPIYKKRWSTGKSILGGNSVPLIFIINKSGKIVHKESGFDIKKGVFFLKKYLSMQNKQRCMTTSGCNLQKY